LNTMTKQLKETYDHARSLLPRTPTEWAVYLSAGVLVLVAIECGFWAVKR
jgi:hypothetical protein